MKNQKGFVEVVVIGILLALGFGVGASVERVAKPQNAEQVKTQQMACESKLGEQTAQK